MALKGSILISDVNSNSNPVKHMGWQMWLQRIEKVLDSSIEKFLDSRNLV